MERTRRQQVQRKATRSSAAAEHSSRNSRSQADVSLTLGANPSQLKQRDSIAAMQHSPSAIAQREKAEAMHGLTTQRVEDEETLQGKMEAVQRVEEDELVQGKMEAVQRVEEDELVQGKMEAVQRVEEDELVQGKMESLQRVEDDELMQGKAKSTSQSTQQLKEQESPNQTGLPDNLKAGIESMSGMSMDNVRVHYNSAEPAQLNAHAFAQGTDIHVASGQEQHLPHEAWHVVQQAQGRVKPTMETSGGAQINDDPGLENEADAMGAKAMQFKPDPASSKSNK